MANIKLGKPAPSAVLETVDGTAVSLDSLWKTGRPTLIIFLRHLA